MHSKYRTHIFAATCLWTGCVQAEPLDLDDAGRSRAASSVPVEIMDTNKSAPKDARSHPRQVGHMTNSVKIAFLEKSILRHFLFGEILKKHDIINEKNITTLVKIADDTFPKDLEKIYYAAHKATPEHLALIANAGFDSSARASVLRAQHITPENVDMYLQLLKGVYDVDKVDELLRVAKDLPDDRLALIARAEFKPESRASTLHAQQITPENVNTYLQLLKGVYDVDIVLMAAKGVPDERLAFLAAAGFSSWALPYALRARQITAQNVNIYLQLHKGGCDHNTLSRVAKDVPDERLSLIANAGFESSARASVLRAQHITPENVNIYVRLLKDVYDIDILLEAAKDMPDERLAFIATAEFETKARVSALRAQHITAQNVNIYVQLLKGVYFHDTLLQAANDVPDEQLALIAEADFKPEDRACVLGARQITPENVDIYLKLLKGVHFHNTLLEAAKDVPEARLALIATAGFEPKARASVLRAQQITPENVNIYVRLLKDVYDIDTLLQAAKDMPEARLAFIAIAGFEPKARASVLRAQHITPENVNIYVRLLKDVYDIDILLEAAKDVPDERLAFIATAGFEPKARASVLRAQQITPENVNIYVRLLKDVYDIDTLLQAAKEVPEEQLALIANAGFESSARASALRAQQITEKI